MKKVATFSVVILIPFPYFFVTEQIWYYINVILTKTLLLICTVNVDHAFWALDEPLRKANHPYTRLSTCFWSLQAIIKFCFLFSSTQQSLSSDSPEADEDSWASDVLSKCSHEKTRYGVKKNMTGRGRIQAKAQFQVKPQLLPGPSGGQLGNVNCILEFVPAGGQRVGLSQTHFINPYQKLIGHPRRHKLLGT